MTNNPLVFPENQVTAVVLGIMQDAGLPHAGCRCPRCAAAFADPARAENAACLGLIDNRVSPASVYLIDATPDIKFQLNLLAGALGAHPERPLRLRQPDGIFITHAHMGHIGGLPQLGKEAMAVTQLPIFAPTGLGQLLLRTELWSPMMADIRLVPLTAGQTLDLAADVQITAVAVPHRDEWETGTLAFRLQGPRHSLLYLPDIDSWDEWPAAADILAEVDYALLDASFYSPDELGGRPPVVHPLVTDTLSRFSHLPTNLYLTHLNHTNPVLDADSDAFAVVDSSPFTLATTGLQFPL